MSPTKNTRKSDRPYNAKANLNVLFGDDEPATSPQIIKIDSISLPDSQPRRYFDPQKLEQLTQSVEAHGILENLLVRPLENKEGSYELVAGERRYRAAIAAGLTSVPVTIRELTDEEAFSIALVENLQREDLNPVEETEGIVTLLGIQLKESPEIVISWLYRMDNEQKKKVTNNVIGKGSSPGVSPGVYEPRNVEKQKIESIFTSLGQNWQSFVNNRLPLLKLPTEILEVLRQGKIEYTKAKAIALVKDEQQRKKILEEALSQNLSLVQIKEKIKALRTSHVGEATSPTVSSSTEDNSAPSPSTQVKTITSRLNRSKLWEKNPKKWKQVQNWLQKIENLLEET
jgi:ParB family transcriptional regulator, chromosome partitioning protein